MDGAAAPKLHEADAECRCRGHCDSAAATGGSDWSQGSSFAVAIERGKLLITADMRAIDEDLRHGAPAEGAGDHLVAQLGVGADVDLDEGLALAVEQPLGRVAIAAKGRGVEDDPAHSLWSDFLVDVPLR